MNEMTARPSERTLDSEIPGLRRFLKPGMKVLDVGCGTGTITLGVAEVVNPGTVVGIDPGSGSIERAREWAEQVKHPGNIRFEVGDSHRLHFADRTFDVVYSNTVLHFFLDPLVALNEQRRVTKKGGWVIASGVRDWGGAGFIYPTGPNWDKVVEAYLRYWDANSMEYRGSGKDPVTFLEEQVQKGMSTMRYMDTHAGRRCLDWFNKAGLSELQIEISGRVQYQEHRELPPSVFDFLNVEEPKTDSQRSGVELIRSALSHIIAMGLLDEQTLKLATEEARAWYKDPGAFRFFPEFFVAGRVP